MISRNTFIGNMAYFSGNAVYIKTVSSSSKSNCGGISIEGNTFQNNVGLKIHNGGAVTIRCQEIN